MRVNDPMRSRPRLTELWSAKIVEMPVPVLSNLRCAIYDKKKQSCGRLANRCRQAGGQDGRSYPLGLYSVTFAHQAAFYVPQVVDPAHGLI